MPALIDKTNLKMPKFEEGDAGIILKADGTFQLWNTIRDPANPTEYQITQGKILMAFAAVLKLPPLLEMLYGFADDPDIFDQVADTGLKQ